MFNIKVMAAKDIGKRRRMEDAGCYSHEGDVAFFAVADGLGGHRNGDKASRLAIEYILENCKDEHPMPDLIKDVHQYLAQKLNGEEGLTTLSLLSIDRKNKTAFVHSVGDSFIYRVRNNQVDLLNQIHGVMHRLTSCIGFSHLDSLNDLDVKQISIKEGDKFILCTDGVGEWASQEDLINMDADQLLAKAKKLSSDNMTVITLWIE